MFDEDLDYFHGDVELVDLVENGFPRKRFTRMNYFQTMDPLGFYKCFRLCKETLLYVLPEIEEDLEYTSDRNNSVSPMYQFLMALRYYSSAGHLMQTADYKNMHKSTTSRLIAKVSFAIARAFPRYVNIAGEENAILREQNNFFNMGRLPRVYGVIDGTHVKITSPGGQNAELYRNRKGYFSLNVQVAGNSNLELIDVVDRWPGSSHDATIFGHCNLRARIEAGEFGNSVFLGFFFVSTYDMHTTHDFSIKNYLLTPLNNPVTREEQLYQESHIRTRNIIERIIGIWKRRFPILAYGSRLNLNTTNAIICATAVLHNIARKMNDPEELPEPHEINADELIYLIEVGNIEAPRVLNHLQRNNIVQRQILNYFRDLPN